MARVFSEELAAWWRPGAARTSNAAIVLLVAFFLAACASTNGNANANANANANTNALFELDGTWRGQVKGFQAAGLFQPPLDYDFWITIDHDEVDLWFHFEDRWVRLWNGKRKFSIARHKSNAVIFASNSKPEAECHWVETWTLTVSQFQPNSLEAFWYRVVNNTGCPDAPGRQFAYGATGTLARVSSAITAPSPIGVYRRP